ISTWLLSQRTTQGSNGDASAPAAQFRGDAVDGRLIGPTKPGGQAGFSEKLEKICKTLKNQTIESGIRGRRARDAHAAIGPSLRCLSPDPIEWPEARDRTAV
ncbi:hypothetical protein, partial [Rhodoblastus sp.]|uniref:hypothetical protein n=1 Tax=Rhodoblastus sp. TaxID=1962975 RepID=UPI0025E25108